MSQMRQSINQSTISLKMINLTFFWQIVHFTIEEISNAKGLKTNIICIKLIQNQVAFLNWSFLLHVISSITYNDQGKQHKKRVKRIYNHHVVLGWAALKYTTRNTIVFVFIQYRCLYVYLYRCRKATERHLDLKLHARIRMVMKKLIINHLVIQLLWAMVLPFIHSFRWLSFHLSRCPSNLYLSMFLSIYCFISVYADRQHLILSGQNLILYDYITNDIKCNLFSSNI